MLISENLMSNALIYYCLHEGDTVSDLSPVQGDEGVCNVLFLYEYGHLYNSVSYDEVEMRRLFHRVSQNINLSCHTGNCKCNHTISVQQVK